MSSLDEKSIPSPDLYASSPVDQPSHLEYEEPLTGWMYRSRKIGRITLPYYASPKTQLLLVSFVCFLCPGMFNALNGLGGGGQLDAKASSDSNTALYSTYSVVAFFAGTIVNTIGIRWALAFGGIGYSIYVSAYLCYNINENLGYMTFAGALLGVCAGVLWSAQGAIMMSYPTEKEKGRSISWFWMIFNLGGVIGSLIPLGQNIHTTGNSKVSNGTYIGFLVLTFLGGLMAWTLVDAKKVVRSDGTRVILMKHPTWKSELVGLFDTLRSEPYIVLLFPMFFASNWFYTYQFNGVNLAKFNTRTRALNNVLYWLMQILAAYLIGHALDTSTVRRTTRAKVAWLSLMLLTFVTWGGGYAFQRTYTRSLVSSPTFRKSDWTDPGIGGPIFLYMTYGFFDAAWQVCIYWFIGTMSNNGRKLANLAGFAKGIQSAGAAVIWRLDGLGVSYMSELASCWALLAGSLVLALPVILLGIKESVSVLEDLKLSDETVEDVVGAAPVGAVAASDHGATVAAVRAGSRHSDLKA